MYFTYDIIFYLFFLIVGWFNYLFLNVNKHVYCDDDGKYLRNICHSNRLEKSNNIFV